MTLYKLEHLHILYDDVEDIKFIGVYSSTEKAERAVAELRTQPGFRDFPDIVTEEMIDADKTEGFYISEVEVDETNWKEGFTTYKYWD